MEESIRFAPLYINRLLIRASKVTENNFSRSGHITHHLVSGVLSRQSEVNYKIKNVHVFKHKSFNLKELSPCHKVKLCNIFIFAT